MSQVSLPPPEITFNATLFNGIGIYWQGVTVKPNGPNKIRQFLNKGGNRSNPFPRLKQRMIKLYPSKNSDFLECRDNEMPEKLNNPENAVEKVLWKLCFTGQRKLAPLGHRVNYKDENSFMEGLNAKVKRLESQGLHFIETIILEDINNPGWKCALGYVSESNRYVNLVYCLMPNANINIEKMTATISTELSKVLPIVQKPS